MIQTQQNQTNPAWLSTGHDVNELGIGIFVLPNIHDLNPDAVTSQVLDNPMTYTECIARGALTIAFKWIPLRIFSNPTITSALAELKNASPCTGDCVTGTDCEKHCICLNGKCIAIIP
jgi:hypothetical protein